MVRNKTKANKTLSGGALGLAGLLLMAQPAAAQQDRPKVPPLSSFSIIEEKNLFHPDRIPQTPAVPPSENKPPALRRVPENFVLHGVILREMGKPIALLQEPTLTENEVRSFTQGETIGPYLLKAVEKDRVVLDRDGRELEVVLYKSGEQASSPPPTPAARPAPPRRTLPRPRPRPPPEPRRQP